MFNLVKEHIDKGKKKRKIDIIFVAHGAIKDEKHPAACLLPLSTITDMLLYSPWNCAIDAEAAYGIATGRIQPQHRDFLCVCEDKCGEEHRPSELPNDFNSMKNAGDQSIPKIMVQPKDGAWDDYLDLTEKYGQPDRRRIVIPFLNPIPILCDPITVPFYVITAALSLALYFSGYEATVHLAACLCDGSEVKFEKEFLEDQYSYTIDNSAMTCSEDTFPARDTELQMLYTALQAVFNTRRV